MPNANPLEGLFIALTKETENELTAITTALASKTITLEEWYDQIATILVNNHLKAASYGRGSKEPNITDEMYAQLYSTDQLQYLSNFKSDISENDPRYIDSDSNYNLGGLLNRIQLYPNQLRVTSIRTWVENIDSDEEIYWRITALESCKDCPYVADGSPYTRSTLYLLPGDGTTECKMNCKCILETKSGLRTFMPV